MATATTNELRTNLHDVLHRAKYAGERVIVTRHGKPIAAIVPLEDLELLRRLEEQIDIAAATQALREAEESGFVPWDDVRAGTGD
jgi:prevent-host-death family protein